MEERLRAAHQWFATEGSEEAFDNLVRTSLQVGTFLDLPASLFIRALAKDPWLAKGIPAPAQAVLATAPGLADFESDDWFPEYRGLVCPRGDRPAEGLDLLDIGVSGYRSLRGGRLRPTQTEVTTAGLGLTETDSTVTHLFVCPACDAMWPIYEGTTIHYRPL